MSASELHPDSPQAIVTSPATPLAAFDAIDETARAFAEASRSAGTRRAYAIDWRHFTTWCDAHRVASLPAAPATVVRYLAASAERYAVATLTRRLASVSQAHQLAGHPSPTQNEAVRTTMKGIRRTKGTRQRQAAAATTNVLKLMLGALPDTLAGTRDRALLLVGFTAALRRSEIVGLDVDDCQFVGEGLVVRLRRSKTDQEGQGVEKAIPYGLVRATCPVRSLKAWLEAASLKEGPVFRPIDRHGNIRLQRLTDRAVALIIKRSAEGAGLDAKDYSGHSLRAGFATSAAAAGASERSIKSQTGHTSDRILQRYIRRGTLFEDNPVGQLGL
ncbi:MAG: hypothetical protein RLZZ387_5332 [Chloroflexota bacterium]